MSAVTGIEWTDSTWTPVRAWRLDTQADGSLKPRIGWHCEHASPGCVNCYSERLNKRLGTGQRFKPAHLAHVTRDGDVRGDVTVFLDKKMLLQPLRWTRGRMIFVCSMTDLFADFVSDEIIDRVFAVMALARQHTYQVLTKRAARMRAYFANPMREALIGRQVGLLELERSGCPVVEWSGLPMPHVWLGVSAEDQQRADERIVELLDTRAKVRFVSVEPMLGPVDLSHWIEPTLHCSACGASYGVHEAVPDPSHLMGADICARCHHDGCMSTTWGAEAAELGCPEDVEPDQWHSGRRLHWIICGGESGLEARPMHPDWVRSLRDQCAKAGVPFHFKQWGEWLPAETEATADGVVAVHPMEGCCVELEDERRYRTTTAHGSEFANVGKRIAGRLLDGVEHNGVPA